MDLQQRIVLLDKLGRYMLSNIPEWIHIKEKAYRENGWFIPEFIDLQASSLALNFLDRSRLEQFSAQYGLPVEIPAQKNIGVVMAGNIPLVGFHDFLCCFLSGHKQTIKMSSKDNVLIRHLVDKLVEWDPVVADHVRFDTMLKGCDAYIATGSNNSARYFDYYFSKYPHIIRRNRTSVAILDGQETEHQLRELADDVYLFFGLGCRNVTKIYVPKNYDFVPLLEAFKKYNHLFDHNKYRNNYDYQLASLLINKVYYMTNGSIILRESEALFSPISELNYEFYSDMSAVEQSLAGNEAVQCIVGRSHTPFGKAQHPELTDFADGIDTMQFLKSL